MRSLRLRWLNEGSDAVKIARDRPHVGWLDLRAAQVVQAGEGFRRPSWWRSSHLGRDRFGDSISASWRCGKQVFERYTR